MSGNVIIERLVKSAERVRDLAEVFTPTETVEAMLDLLPSDVWEVHPSATFLEPACGDGNFLVALLRRKLDRVAAAQRSQTLPAGDSDDAILFHALQALASIYAVDISEENVVGGVPGHEVGARARLLDVFSTSIAEMCSKRLTEGSAGFRAALWIVNHNIVVGNMLAKDAQGSDTNRDKIPLIEYVFDLSNNSVRLLLTCVGDVFAAEAAKVATEMSLFGSNEPALHWQGNTLELAEAPCVEAPKVKGQARNGAGGRR